MKIEEIIQRYFRTEIYKYMTQVRYFSKKICIEIFSELAQKGEKAPPPPAATVSLQYRMCTF